VADNVTLSSLRDQARKRADMENSSFWTDAQVNTAINASLKRLYNFLVSTFNDEYYVTSEDISSVAGQGTYSLNASFFKLLGIDVGNGASPTQWFSLEKFAFAERNTRRDHTWAIHDYRYRLWGSTVKVIPTPPGGLTFRVWYIPAMTELSADGDTADGVSGFEEWVVLDVAMKMLRSEESDTAELAADKAEMEQHIKEMASPRDANSPASVVDVESVHQDEYWAFWTRRQ